MPEEGLTGDTPSIDAFALGLISIFEDNVNFLVRDRPPDLRPEALEFVGRLRFNAFVEPEADKTSRLTFWQGCGICLLDLIISLLTEREFLSDLDRDFCSIGKGQQVDGRFWNYEWLKQKEDSLPVKFETKRLLHLHANDILIVNHLMELCVKFLFDHEVSHIKFGHLEQARAFGLLYLEESSAEPSSVPLPTRRKWELEADVGALYNILRAGRNETHRSTAHVPCVNTAAWDSFVIIACDIVFSIMQLAEAGLGKESTERDHPSAAARMINILMWYVELIHQKHLTHDSASDEALFSYIWLDVLRNFVPIANLTGVLPVTYPDLKCTVFGGDPKEWPITPIVREWMEVRGLKEIPRVEPWAEVLAWPGFISKSSPDTAVPYHPAAIASALRRARAEIQFDDRLRYAVALSDLKTAALYFHHILPLGIHRTDEGDSSVNKWSIKDLTLKLFPEAQYQRLASIQGYKEVEFKYTQVSLLLTRGVEHEGRYFFVRNTIKEIATLFSKDGPAFGFWAAPDDLQPTSVEDARAPRDRMIIVNNVPLIDTKQTSWEHIFAMRDDPESLRQMRGLRIALLEDYSAKSESYVRDHLTHAIDDHHQAVKKWGLATLPGTFQVLLSDAQWGATGLSAISDIPLVVKTVPGAPLRINAPVLTAGE